MVKASDYSIKVGGLFRCCIKTILDTELEAEPEEGHTLQCDWCRGLVTMHKGFWQWCPDDGIVVPASP